ncbi:hypothetical protein D3C84_894190 [compost metagenome]
MRILGSGRRADGDNHPLGEVGVVGNESVGGFKGCFVLGCAELLLQLLKVFLAYLVGSSYRSVVFAARSGVGIRLCGQFGKRLPLLVEDYGQVRNFDLPCLNRLSHLFSDAGNQPDLVRNRLPIYNLSFGRISNSSVDNIHRRLKLSG